MSAADLSESLALDAAGRSIAEGTVVSVVRGVRVLGRGEPVDLVLEDGRIKAFVPSGIDHDHDHDRGLVLLPGLVDLHTHLREPGGEAAETIGSGTAAAAAGGYTDVFAMANTDPVSDTVARIEEVRRRSIGASARVHPVAAATIGLSGIDPVDVSALRGAGVTVFSDDGHCVSDDRVAYEVMRAVAAHGGVFAQHAQSPTIVRDGVINDRVAAEAGCAGWPGAGEEAVIGRDIALVQATGAALHVCHVSTARSAELVRWAKAAGLPVTAEVTPHHLVLRDQDALERGPALKVNPPMREEPDTMALRRALRDGTIDIVATDHAPHSLEAKRRSWTDSAFGMTGVETALAVVAEVLQGERGADWEGIARVMSHAPAARGGVAATAGRPLVVGEPANFCVVEEGGPWPVCSEHHRSASRNTPFEGRPVMHRVVLTVLDGTITYRRRTTG